MSSHFIPTKEIQVYKKELIAINGSKKLYAEHKPAGQNAPTVALLNGLTYSTDDWDAFAPLMEDENIGILKFDFVGQGKSIAHNQTPDSLKIEENADDLFLLLQKLEIKKPILIGLSYGGAVAVSFAAKYPKYVSEVILMAPYLQKDAKQDNMLRACVQGSKMMMPFGLRSDDELYDMYLKNLVYMSYPAVAALRQRPEQIDGVYKMTQGARHFDAKNLAGLLPKNSVGLIIPTQDEYIPAEVFENFWNVLPDSAKASKHYMEGAKHKIPQENPRQAADIVKKIIYSRQFNK